MLTRMIDVAGHFSPAVKRSLVRLWFQYLAALDKEADLIFMNYGYVDLNPAADKIALREVDEVNRYCIQLYQFVAAAIELTGREVLEVGCGRGGGASYIMRYLQPGSMTGVDISEKAIAFCNRHHSVAGLSFFQGDAESLPFDDSSFDVLMNVESSHCYGSMERFLREACRVLRPNGYLLYTDFRRKDQIDSLRQQLRHSGLALLQEERITPNVLKALDHDHLRRGELIRRKVPRILHKIFHEFAGTRGTKTYAAFQTGEVDYLSFILSNVAE